MARETKRDRLLREYDELEDQIEMAAIDQIWVLADWLADNVPNEGAHRPKTAARAVVSMAELATRRRRSVSWLNSMRRVADATKADRIPDVGVRTYELALGKAGWDLERANGAIRESGTRQRDHQPRSESPEALRRGLYALPPKERARIAAQIVQEEETQTEMAKALAGTEAAQVVAGTDYQKRKDDAAKRMQERRATKDPAKRARQDELQREWEQRDFASGLMASVSRIRLEVLAVLERVRDYEGSVVGEEIDNSRQLLRELIDDLGVAANALDQLEGVDIDELIGRLTADA